MICASEEFVIDEEARNQFTRLLPEIQQKVAFRFCRLSPSLREDRTAEAVALAFGDVSSRSGQVLNAFQSGYTVVLCRLRLPTSTHFGLQTAEN